MGMRDNQIQFVESIFVIFGVLEGLTYPFDPKLTSRTCYMWARTLARQAREHLVAITGRNRCFINLLTNS